MQKVGFWSVLKTSKKGIEYIELSISRLFSSIAIIPCLLMTWGIIDKTFGQFSNVEVYTWQELCFSLLGIIFINLIWIAPKHLSKAIEEKGIIAKVLEKK